MKFTGKSSTLTFSPPWPAVAGLAVSLLLADCTGNDKQKEGGSPDGPGGAPQGPKAYAVMTVQPQRTTLFTDVPATVQGTQNVDIRPKVDGYIEAIYVDEGATVRKGQRMFRLNAPQYAQDVITAQAAIRTAQADVNTAQMAVEKVRPLVEKEIVSDYQLKTAQFTLESKQAALAQANATLANARTNLGYTLITSPVDGVVGSIPYRIGNLITASTTSPLTTVTSISRVYAYFALNEKQLLTITRTNGNGTLQQKLARMPDVSLVLADGSVYNHKGRVETAVGQINTETGSSNFRATFSNPESLLRSGSSGLVRTPQPIDSALVVPQRATYELQGKRFLYVVSRDSVAKSREVLVAPTPDGQSFVVQKGLTAGDRVVTEGASELRDGTKIIPRTGIANPPTTQGQKQVAGR
ncbi:efflux RND transporter periplasmic adaptor subunit [Spirosoma soli]|uniref:Efflux RND transporter periplasmic adaptor subunit n=1 Tax=Spirosoma soli TaxID=1770529 RepID=A0ABW5M1G8_9BACT